MKSKNSIFCLYEKAQTWFENKDDDLNSLDIPRSTILTSLPASSDRQRFSRNRLVSRAQHEFEGFMSYLKDILCRCQRIHPNRDEKEKLSHLKEGVREDGFRVLISKNAWKNGSFSPTCNLFDKAQRSCLSKSVYYRLPNLTASFSSSTAHVPVLRALIKQTARDKLRAVLPDPLYQTLIRPYHLPSPEPLYIASTGKAAVLSGE